MDNYQSSSLRPRLPVVLSQRSHVERQCHTDEVRPLFKQNIKSYRRNQVGWRINIRGSRGNAFESTVLLLLISLVHSVSNTTPKSRKTSHTYIEGAASDDRSSGRNMPAIFCEYKM